VDGDQNETSQSAGVDSLDAATVEYEYYLDSNPNDAIAEEVVSQTIEPEVVTVPDGNNDQAEPAPDQVNQAPVQVPEEAPGEIPGVRRSTRVRLPTKPGYIPSMSGSLKYVHVVTRLESQGTLFATGTANQSIHEDDEMSQQVLHEEARSPIVTSATGRRRWQEPSRLNKSSSRKQSSPPRGRN
jgi:hypothetical protein